MLFGQWLPCVTFSTECLKLAIKYCDLIRIMRLQLSNYEGPMVRGALQHRLRIAANSTLQKSEATALDQQFLALRILPGRLSFLPVIRNALLDFKWPHCELRFPWRSFAYVAWLCCAVCLGCCMCVCRCAYVISCVPYVCASRFLFCRHDHEVQVSAPSPSHNELNLWRRF